MSMLGALLLGFIAAAIIGIAEENRNVYKSKKETPKEITPKIEKKVEPLEKKTKWWKKLGKDERIVIIILTILMIPGIILTIIEIFKK